MHDAMQNVISAETRAAAAFDAGYTWLLVALDAPTGQTHPGVEAIVSGVERLGIDAAAMTAARAYMDRQYTATGTEDLLDALVAWAQQMKALAGAV